MQVCTSLQTDNHASTPPLSFLQAGCPSCRPTNSVKALKAHAQQIWPSLDTLFLSYESGEIYAYTDCNTLHSDQEKVQRIKVKMQDYINII